jgi:NADH-quinone oxidoreductase subunit L
VSATTYGWLVLAFPLAGSLVTAFGFRWLPGRSAGWIATGAIFAAFISAIGALFMLLDHPATDRELTSSLYDYASAAGLDIDMGILVDPLSVYMCLIVSGVSALIHLYSVTYMESDRGLARYFSYLNFFVFSMLLLILAGNFVLLIVGWAFVGFASYALISFWYRRDTAVKAGMKAFVINVIGDIGLVFAAFFIFREIGSFDYLEVFEATPETFSVNDGTAIAICVGIMVGAFAKSAQLPLHTWLPDAMEGPTPVSALIHAATMVTAGVYLIARTHSLFEVAPTAADIAAFTGLATLIFAASVALVVTDIKRIIAYSTISQIGYMIVGVSIGAYAAGLFHLMTHAFFKALLFMAAGSIIGAMAGVQSIDRMSGFRRALWFTGPMLAIGALALAGAPPFSGWLSKDEILVFATERGGFYWIFAIGGYIAAAMTAFYAFRITFRVLYGEPCPEARELEEGRLAHADPVNPMTGEPEDTEVGFPGPGHYIAERATPMKIAMGILGFLATVAGVLQIPGVTDVVDTFHPSTGAAYVGLAVGAAMAAIGIGIAYYLYVVAPGTTDRIRARASGLHTFLSQKWYFDELYDAVFYRPMLAVGRFANSVVERVVVDGLVSATVDAVRGVGLLVRSAQSGFVRAYALLLIGGFAALGLYFLIASS